MSKPTQPESMPLQDKLELIKYLMMFPALSIMVFMRRKVGYRMLKSSWLIILAVLLSAYDGLYGTLSGDFHKQPLNFLMTLYVWSMLGAGFFQQWLRWREIAKGIRWHTYSVGISYLEYLPLPRYFFAHRRIYRQLDPALVFLYGLFVARFCHALGLWLMFSAIALYVYEQTLYERDLERDLDILDLLISAEVQNETVKHFQGVNAEEKHFRLDDTAGIPTGLAPDIHRQIELRKIRMNAEQQI